MTLGQRLQQLRRELGLSQEAIGAQGFVSAPGWIKLESGQRSPSERLLDQLCQYVAREKKLTIRAAAELAHELKTLKYLGSRSAFVRALAQDHARTLPNGEALLATTERPAPKRGRPPGTGGGRKQAARATAIG